MAFVERIMPMISYRIERQLSGEQPWMRNTYAMSPDVFQLSNDEPFMASSTCSARDFYHPEFRKLCDRIGAPVQLHRKLWEWVFIIHHAFKMGVVRPGARGLVFGVGRELLPAVFVGEGMHVTATDAPDNIASASGWSESAQRSENLAGLPSGSLIREVFEAAVEWRACDMNAIDPELTGYDLVWSSCCLEHLGSIEAGLDFIINSVEQTLRPGGLAVHTTELNLSSNEATVDSGNTVLYRRRDLDGLISNLRARGHEVNDLIVAPDTFVMDTFVDTPPYDKPHLRVLFEGYVTTSVGIVVRKKFD